MRYARGEAWRRLMLGRPPPARRLIRLLSQHEQAVLYLLYSIRKAVRQVLRA